jgi:hypothetical protein
LAEKNFILQTIETKNDKKKFVLAIIVGMKNENLPEG